ncbi:MAG: trigger factor [Bacteroidetes bacterium]|nr:trigger factor [Bacteroidota bacterium]
MNITKENIDELNAVVKVNVGPADYTEKVEHALKNYQKKASMPGFRPGKVPPSLVRKMYGKSVLAEEINRILSDSLYKYIQENKLDVLGNPLPKDENNNVDFDNQIEFEFQFDMALAPQFTLDLGAGIKLNEYVVRIEDKLIDGYVSDMTRRYGKIAPIDAAGDGDLIYGDFVELDEKGEIVPGGIFKASTMFLDNPVKEDQKILIGAKAEDKFDLTTKQIADNAKELATKLGIEEHAAETLTCKFRFTVKTINRLIPAELNAELFEKIYGPGAVNTPEEFRGKIAEELTSMFTRDAEQRLRNDISGELLNKTNLSLPDAFLKRWLIYANEKPVTQDQVDAEYPMYARQLRWQLIENKLIRDNQISVTPEEAEEHVKVILRGNFAKYGRNPDEVSDEELTGTAKRVLEKEEEAKKIFEELYAQKLMMLYRTKINITPKEVSYDEFLKGGE